MRATGIVLLFIGAIAFFVVFTMDTSVATDFGGRVHNIGLMNDGQNIIIVAGVLAVIGAIFVGFASKSPQPIESAVENSSVRICPYCAETIKTAATICRFCQKELPPIIASVTPQVAPPNDDQPMNEFGITFDGERYCYESYRYDKLADAITYAKLQANAFWSLGG